MSSTAPKTHPLVTFFGKPFVKKALIVTLLVSLSMFSLYWLNKGGKSLAGKWDQPATKLPTEQISFADPLVKARLQAQHCTIRMKADKHLEITNAFYTWHYMAITQTLLFGAIGGVALFTIAQCGWGNAGQYSKTVFLTASSISLFFGVFPKIYQQEQNIANNKQIHLNYRMLDNEILTYLSTGKNIQGKDVKPELFINYLDQKMNQLNDIAVGLDDSQVPDFSQSLKMGQ